MRLIKLRVKNIASLKGDHEINFAEIQGQSPLFAITGETGSGKSSILNAIGLVLYGKVYKSNVLQIDLVTLGEKEGQIELLFQSKGKNYLAFWKARVRKQNGEYYSTPQTPQRELYALEGHDFDSPKTILTTKTEELLNLDFDQFTKCIILNQGEFARFLSSSFSDRKDILEKLYPGEMFDKLSAKLKEEKSSLEKQISDLDIELHALQGEGLSGNDLTLQKNDLETQYKLHESWLTTLESMEFHFGSLYNYHTKNKEAETKIESIRLTLTKETSVLNEFMTLTQKASEELSLTQKEMDKRRPRLEELLKFEENLKHLTDQKVSLAKEQERLALQLGQLKVRQKVSADQLQIWHKKNQELEESFIYKISDLSVHQKNFEPLFDLYSKKELLDQELLTKEERLTQLEHQGKDEARELKELTSKKSSFEEEKVKFKNLEEQKKQMLLQIDQRKLSELKLNETSVRLSEIQKERQDNQNLLDLKTLELKKQEEEFLPLSTTLKLETLLNAVEVCLTHPKLDEDKNCPVCKTHLTDSIISGLRNNIHKTDLAQIRLKEAELSRKMIKAESEIQALKDKIQRLILDEAQKNKEAQSLNETIKIPAPSLDLIDSQISQAQKLIWEQEKILKDEERVELALKKTREQYLALKNELTTKQNSSSEIAQRLSPIKEAMIFLGELTTDSVQTLRQEARKFQSYLDHKNTGDKLGQEKTHLDENAKEVEKNANSGATSLADITQKAQDLAEILTQELSGKKASDLLSELSQKLKEKSDHLKAREKELKDQELKLKDSQSRLYTLEEQLKELDLFFAKERFNLKEMSRVSLPPLSKELSMLTEKLGSLTLELKSPSELFSPLKDLIESQKTQFKEKTSELKMSFASVRARLEDWEKRQDRITLLHLKLSDLTTVLDRRSRLYEVLGKDELRTFVLSLVEENLIIQTNDELQKLCQGRYEIVHQSRKMKLTPEFYILDKFREGGLRKVSTLSGGETFMVSLAMALGLAEMTRGKAEIDTLFIDEGFGTLDQDSLEDVLDMLKQIQTRGLMVGIISHVKALTNALPVNLQVTKKQDGTSSIGMVFN